MFLIGAIQCWRVIIPVDFWLPGCEPENWETDVVAGKKLHDCLGERAGHIQQQIAENLSVIEANAKKFRSGALCGIVAPFVGVAAWAVASACHWHG
jgi:NADH:ubiquinone oxidoreductase subunit B-like Fe-S oxidoreductase